MLDFYRQLDALRDEYVDKELSDAEWRLVIDDLLASIDELLPAYQKVTDAERLALAKKMRDGILTHPAKGGPDAYWEVALDAATLRKALADAVAASASQ